MLRLIKYYSHYIIVVTKVSINIGKYNLKQNNYAILNSFLIYIEKVINNFGLGKIAVLYKMPIISRELFFSRKTWKFFIGLKNEN